MRQKETKTLREVQYTYTKKGDSSLEVNTAILEAFGISVLAERE